LTHRNAVRGRRDERANRMGDAGGSGHVGKSRGGVGFNVLVLDHHLATTTRLICCTCFHAFDCGIYWLTLPNWGFDLVTSVT
jgi:hypothetical protein